MKTRVSILVLICCLATAVAAAREVIHKGDVVVALPAWNRNYVSEGGGSMNLGDAIPTGKK